MAVMITIIPNPGQEKFIAQDLLAVADHPRDVEYVSRPVPGFRVSEELYERFEAFQNRDVVEPVKAEESDPVTEAPTDVAAPKRGRPKKKVEDQ